MNPSRILYCESNCDGTIGGSFFSLFYLVEGLNKEEFEPRVIFYTNNTLIPTYRNAGIKTIVFSRSAPFHIHNIKSRFILFRITNKLLGLIQSAFNLTKFFIIRGIKYAFYLKKNQIQLVHLNNSITRNHDWMLACFITGTKCITHERGINRRYSFLSRFFSRRLGAIICISNAVKQNMLDKGLNMSNYRIIYNCIDPTRLVIDKKEEYVLRKHGIKSGRPVIGIIGNIKEWKGQESVVRATAIIKEKNPEIICLLVGDIAENDQYYFDRLTSLIKDLNIEDSIIFTGHQKNVGNYLNIMDVVIHASIDPEPFGRVLVEAMAAEKPIVGSRAGAVPEIIVENETGTTFKPDDAEELASKVIQLLNDPVQAKIMGKKGYRRLCGTFHIKQNIKLTEDLYHELIG